MAAFQDIKEHAEQKVMVHLFSEIERNPAFTQRGLASELGIALGLINQYLKRCITKGWIRASQVSPKRITYFLTPEGFKEKSQMVTGYLARSLTFFRDSRTQCEEIFSACKLQGWTNIGLVGAGDLADISSLVAQGTGIAVKVLTAEDPIQDFDAVLVTDTTNPQGTYNLLKTKVDSARLLTLPLLHISQDQP